MGKSEDSLDAVDPVVGEFRNSEAAVGSAREELLLKCIRGVVRGEKHAWQLFYDKTSASVFTLARRMVGNREDAEEVTLDVYLKAWKNAARYDSSKGSVMAWLIMMTRTLGIDRLRARRSASMERYDICSATRSSPEPTPEAMAVAGSDRKCIRAALDSLPPEQRQTLELAFFSGLTHPELAEYLKQPLGTVKTRIRLGLMRLRTLLENRS